MGRHSDKKGLPCGRGQCTAHCGLGGGAVGRQLPVSSVAQVEAVNRSGE